MLADRRVERAAQVVQQTARARARIAFAESVDGQRLEPGEDVVADTGARCADERDRLGEEPASDEAENLR